MRSMVVGLLWKISNQLGLQGWRDRRRLCKTFHSCKCSPGRMYESEARRQKVTAEKEWVLVTRERNQVPPLF
jgi:hypothetical protein